MNKFLVIVALLTSCFLLNSQTNAEKLCVKNKVSLNARGKVVLKDAISKVTGSCPSRTTEIMDLGSTLAAFAKIDYNSDTNTQTILSFGGTGTTSASVERQFFFLGEIGFKVTFNGNYPQLTAENSAENRAKVISTASAESLTGHGPVLVSSATSSKIEITISTWNESDPIAFGLNDWNIHVAIAN
jgi:hypothetical protein